MARPYREYRFVADRLGAIIKYLPVGALLYLAAFLLAFDAVAVVLGIATLGWGPYAVKVDPSPPNLFMLLVSLIIWAVLLRWAGATDSIKRSMARAGWALCVSGFLLPTMAFTVYMAPPSPGALFSPGFIRNFLLIVGGVVGGVVGLTGFGLAKASAPEDTPEDSIWFMFRPLGGGKAALATGLLWLVAVLLYLAAYVMNRNGYEGFF